MTRVVVNETENETDPKLKTWGDLLERLDLDLAQHGQIVTAARFDGVEKPTFRDEAALQGSLSEIACVEIDAGTPSELLQQSLGEAQGALETLRAAARRIGAQFRGEDVTAANRDLAALAESLRTLVALVDVSSQALEVDVNTLLVSGQPARKLVHDTTADLGSLIIAQQSKDWAAVADGLEHDVAPALDRWRDLLATLRNRAVVASTN